MYVGLGCEVTPVQPHYQKGKPSPRHAETPVQPHYQKGKPNPRHDEILEYASSICDPYETKHVNQLEIVQRRAARLVCKKI